MPDPKEPQSAAPEPQAPEPQPQVEQPTEKIELAAQPAPPPPPATADRNGKFGRFARHRATGLVAAGLLGLVIGGGLVAVFDHGHGRGPDRVGVSRHDDRGADHRHDRGPNRPPDRFER